MAYLFIHLFFGLAFKGADNRNLGITFCLYYVITKTIISLYNNNKNCNNYYYYYFLKLVCHLHFIHMFLYITTIIYNYICIHSYLGSGLSLSRSICPLLPFPLSSPSVPWVSSVCTILPVLVWQARALCVPCSALLPLSPHLIVFSRSVLNFIKRVWLHAS